MTLSRIILIVVILLPFLNGTGTGKDICLRIDSPMSPPYWAMLERELLRANSAVVSEFYDTYNDQRGYLLHTPRWGTLDGPDDAIETYAKWPLLFLLGASDDSLSLFKRAMEGHLLQYKELRTEKTALARDGAYHKEFITMSDWHHTGEGMQGFMNLGLCDPTDEWFQERIRRFAGFYMDEDPEAPNYDPQHRVIRSLWNGSKGPMLRRATQYDWVGDPVSGKFHILHSADGRQEMVDFAESYPEMLAHCAEYLHSVGDHPLNLLSTQLALNAYALANESNYRDWLLEYVNAWKERTDRNGGNIPTNIGLDGSIGGETGGNWFGGTYGWDFAPWSPEYGRVAYRNMFRKGMWPGFGNALMVTGDQEYVSVLRRQIDNIYAQKRVVDGRVRVPQNFGVKGLKDGPPLFEELDGELTWKERKITEPGWYNWTDDLYIPELTDIYMWSMDRGDLERLPLTGWIGFLEGKEPGYPEEILRGQLSELRERLSVMRRDPTTPDSRLADWAMILNPVNTHELVKLMMGGYLHGRIWVPHVRVRYFDPVSERAGIPADVAALVTGMGDKWVDVILVNLNQVQPRELIVQTGAYGEHQCISVLLEGGETLVDGRFFRVELAPGAGARMKIQMRRYANQPTLAFPWH